MFILFPRYSLVVAPAPMLLAAVVVVPLVVLVEDVLVVLVVLKKGFALPITVGRQAAVLVLVA